MSALSRQMTIRHQQTDVHESITKQTSQKITDEANWSTCTPLLTRPKNIEAKATGQLLYNYGQDQGHKRSKSDLSPYMSLLTRPKILDEAKPKGQLTCRY